MKLVVVTPFNTATGALQQQVAHSDIANVEDSSFSYKVDAGVFGTGGTAVTQQAALVTLNSGKTMYVKETMAQLVAVS